MITAEDAKNIVELIRDVNLGLTQSDKKIVDLVEMLAIKIKDTISVVNDKVVDLDERVARLESAKTRPHGGQ
jgi:hypothetical protein